MRAHPAGGRAGGDRESERGAALVLVAASLVALMGVCALAVDVGMLHAARTRLQATADAAALAAAPELPNEEDARTVGIQYGRDNQAGDSAVVRPADVVAGFWDRSTTTFIPGGTPRNAVRVIARRTTESGNPVGLHFARVLGIREASVSVTAIAWPEPGARSRFLIDDEMIDSDEEAIKELAEKYGMKPDEIINDLDGDWFIDMPPGEIIELPTGQVGDEALFDIDHVEYPFGTLADPSHADFLNYNEDSSSWRYHLIPKEMLDPLVGVSTVNDPDRYASYVDPYFGPGCDPDVDFIHVSPVFKSDVSELDPVNGTPAVNALGWRRGLLVFKIVAVGTDPDGPAGSRLPNLVIETCPPTAVTDLSAVKRTVGGRYQLVR